MDKHTLKLLEFEMILASLGEYCFSEQGRDALQLQPIATTPEDVKASLNLTTSLRKILESGEALPELDFPALTPFLPRLQKGGSVLEAEELAFLGRYLLSAKKLKQFIVKVAGLQAPGRDGISFGALIEKAEALPDMEFLTKEIFRIVDTTGEVKENKIPELWAIRKRIMQLQKEVDKVARQYLSDPDNRTIWQADQPTQKDGRIVLPLKANFKGRVKGIVHEASASGATLFIEPFEVVEKNNSVVEQENAYRQELLRILRALTSQVAAHAQDIFSLVDQISFLDTVYAKARYAISYRCAPAMYSPGYLQLMEARHPLLGAKVVPITIVIGDTFHVLIITGPNTGGKTVTLKTCGLLCVMNQFGMEIPAMEGSKLDIFDNVFADIGDEQSLEQSLSTFSAHIVNLARIIKGSTRRSLVLLDELGAGTDPEEGVAIAMAILDHFIELGTMTVATTHHGILKNYGYTKAGVENASMEFNTHTLTPTYHILIGVPGESHALDIASRHGIPPELIKKAGSYLKDERSNISELIRGLSEKQKQLIHAEQTHKAKETELKEKTRETDLKELKLRQKEMELREHGVADIKNFMTEARQELQNLIKEIREEGAISKDKTRRAESFLQELRTYAEQEETSILKERATAVEHVDLAEGMPVVFKSNGRHGIIRRKGKDDTWIVETEKFKIAVQPDEIYPVKAQQTKPKVEIVSNADIGHEFAMTIDVRGCRYEEAIQRVERQLDNAAIKGIVEFSIIHGTGTGVLQEGIHRFLAQNPLVADYYFSPPEEGGFGKTIVRLKG